MARPITAETVVTAISSLTDPAKIATLSSDNACNSRLNKCVYWVHQAEVLGLDLPSTLSRAVSNYEDTDQHRALTIKSLLINHRRMDRAGCYTAENLVQLRKGRAAVITRGAHIGQTMEVDHIVPKSLVPSLAKDFANLRFTPFEVNRTKSDTIRAQQLRAVKIFVREGLIPESAVARIEPLAEQNLSVRDARSILPGNTAHLATLPYTRSFAADAIDPRLILSRMDELRERICEWEPRADSAVSAAELMQRQTAEHVTRTGSLLRQAQTRQQDDADLVRRLETELANWHTRGEADMARAGLCVNNAHDKSRRARQAIQRWKHELHLAHVWQNRAEYRENRARNEVERAEESLNRAKEVLSRAEDALERARDRTKVVGRDSDGRQIREPIDTTPFENKVAAAQERVDRCDERLDRANEELGLARAEHEAAEARVGSCTQAVAVANDADVAATAALKFAQNAVSAIERASEEHTRATHFIEEARESLKHGQRAILAMDKRVEVAVTHESEGSECLLSLQKNHSLARLHSTRGCMEMSHRMEQLQAFDRAISEF